MEFQGEDVSLLWKLSGQERIEAFEAAYAQYGPRMFAFPSFYGSNHYINALESLLRAPAFNQRPQSIKTIALYYFTYGFGGVERCLSYLMPQFLSLGYNVIFITDTDASSDAYPTPKGVKRLVFNASNSRVHPFHQLQGRCTQWETFIKENHIDAVYYAYSSNHVRMIDFPVIRASGAYLFYHFHCCFSLSLHTESAKHFYNFSKYIRFADSIITLSRADTRFFELCGVRAYYIPNKCFFDIKQYKQKKVNLRQVKCLWSGRFAPPKSPLEIIPIFSKIYQAIPNATLIILGSTTPAFQRLQYDKKMRKQAKDLGCADAIRWEGFQEDVQPYYDSSDLLICTSLFEGFPLTHIEAYAHGVPIVSYDMPYLETLKDEKASRCVPQGDQQAAAEAAIELLTNPEVYREASQAARKVAETFMDFDQAAAWKKVIEELPQPYTPQETEADQIDRVMLETILLHGTWARLPQQTQNQLVQTRKQLAAAQTELRKLRATRAWRIGRAVTFLPRKAKGGIKCLRENGLRYTLRRAVKKVLRH